MIKQYPHSCTYQVDAPAVWSVGNGWVPGVAGKEQTTICRAVSSSSGRLVKKNDGSVTDYSFDLAFPLNGPVLTAGTKVRITGIDGELLIDGFLLRFQKGQLHSRGWV